MREESSREETVKKEKLVGTTTQKQRKTDKFISSFLLSIGQDVSNKTPIQLSNFSSSEL